MAKLVPQEIDLVYYYDAEEVNAVLARAVELLKNATPITDQLKWHHEVLHFIKDHDRTG